MSTMIAINGVARSAEDWKRRGVDVAQFGATDRAIKNPAQARAKRPAKKSEPVEPTEPAEQEVDNA